MPLRPYQQTAIDKTLGYFKSGKRGNPLVELPTGSGKTHVLGGLCLEIHNRWSEVHVLIVSHVKEILKQDYEALIDYLPRDVVGLYSAGLKSRQVRKFTVAGIQSICNKPELFKDYKVIIVDEAHLIPTSGEGRYRKFIDSLSSPRIIGLTATPFRLGSGHLIEGDIFDSIVYKKEISELIEEGYLCPLSTKETNTEMSTRNIAKIGGDFNNKELSSALDRESVTSDIVNELLRFKDTRKHWLVFAIDIKHAEHINDTLLENGIVSACVHSRMETDREPILELFKEGGFQCLVSIETLTTGFDAPNIDLVALCRPTVSPVLHIQMIGRGLRIAPNKRDCLVLDFAGNTARLGPIDDVTVKSKLKGDTKKLTKSCEVCKEIVSLACRTCPTCGHKFIVKETETCNLLTTADSSAVLKGDIEIEMNKLIVDSIRYSLHSKPNKIDSMKVTYKCGLRSFDEWVLLEHVGYPKHKAWHWWMFRTEESVPPETVMEALERVDELKPARSITVETGGSYPVIKEIEVAL